MNIYIFFEHITREYHSLIKLKNILKKNNENVYLYSIIFERGKALRKAKKFIPDIIIMPWLAIEMHEQIILPFLKLNNKVRVVNLHHEEIGCPANEAVFLPTTTFSKNGSFHLVWANNFKEKLLGIGVDENRIYITGNIRNDEAHQTNVDKKTIAGVYNLDIKKKWILFAENRGYFIQRVDSKVEQEILQRGADKDYVKTRKRYEENGLEYFIADLNSVDEMFFEEYELIYRPHPGTVAPPDIPKYIKVIDERSIYDWITVCDLFISCESTSIFEAEMKNKPCVIYNDLEKLDRFKIYGLERYPSIRSISEVNENLIEELAQKNTHIYEEYMGTVDGRATERVADALYKICNAKYDAKTIDCVGKINNPKYFFFLKLTVYEIVTYIFVKLGLLEKLKYPNSSYKEKGDIPYSKENKWIFKER